MLSRLKQVYRYIFLKFNKKNEEEVKKILSIEEFEIFTKMREYDKLHSFLVYKKCSENKILKNNKNYLKLALLHDCGKGNTGLLKRVKKVLIGDEKLEKHSENAFEILKDINIDVARLCRDHHRDDGENEMKIFQKIDDE
ncbi:MAG: HD domain-containing protein [Cetobacterium sp.]|uniref:HD domain-containing protein n=1 Tax=Cetobacterium sp. TaxID=2071632 RepID=UPI003F3BB8C5